MPDATGLSFIEADLRDRSFAGQDLSGAVFRSTDLRGVDFTQATLQGASFEGCRTGISPKQKIAAPIVALVTLVVLSPIGAACGYALLDPHRQVDVNTSSSDSLIYGFLVSAIVVVGGLVGFGAEKLTTIRSLTMVGIAGGGVGAGLGLFGVAVFYVVQAFVLHHVWDGILRLLFALLPLGFLALAAYVGHGLYRDRTGTDFGAANLMQAQFQLMRLQNCNFVSAQLDGISWADCEFVGCEFKDSQNKLVDKPPESGG